MRFSDKTKVYRTDGGLVNAVSYERSSVVKLTEKLLKDASSLTYRAAALLAPGRVGGYEDEIRSVAEDVGVSGTLLLGMNLIYDLSHLQEASPFGCSSAVVHTEKFGMVHMRCLDWGISGLGRLTCVFEDDRYMMVGFPGFSGALSGMVHGKFSLSLNWAPPSTCALHAISSMSPPFLLRYVLDNANSYEDAHRLLANTPVSCPVFFTLCGSKKGEACVIERTEEHQCTTKIGTKGHLIQTNHFRTRGFTYLNEGNEEDDIYGTEHSKLRESKLTKALSKLRNIPDMEQCREVLVVPEVENEDTCQQMVLSPRESTYRLWRRT